MGMATSKTVGEWANETRATQQAARKIRLWRVASGQAVTGVSPLPKRDSPIHKLKVC